MTRPFPTALLAGQPVTRVDGRLKVTGAARYSADHPVEGLVYATLVCSTVARGTVERVNTDAALGHPDVLRILTDFGGTKLPYDPLQVASFGQPVAVVVATTLETAMHGASLVEVRYRGTTAPLTDMDAPQAVQEPGQTARVRDYARGDADTALRHAAVVSDLQYSIARNNHNPMELPATIASWDGDRLTVWDKVQGISWSLEAYSEAFGIPLDNTASSVRSSGAGSAVQARPGRTRCWRRSRPGRCADR